MLSTSIESYIWSSHKVYVEDSVEGHGCRVTNIIADFADHGRDEVKRGTQIQRVGKSP